MDWIGGGLEVVEMNEVASLRQRDSPIHVVGQGEGREGKGKEV